MTKEEYEALAAFRYNLRRFLRHSEVLAREAGLAPQQHQLLLAIKGMPGRDWATPRDLAERLQVRHNAAVQLIDRVSSLDLVERKPDPTDARQVRVYLTRAGDEVLARLTAAHRRELASEDVRHWLRPPR